MAADRFDLIWVLVRDPDSGEYRFLMVDQALLDGDAHPGSSGDSAG